MSTRAFDPEETTQWEKVRPRTIDPEQWKRFEGYAAEIFQTFGMDLDIPAPGLLRPGSSARCSTPPRDMKAMPSS
jgi:hypothetical protein